jgi:hypothetical protein
MTEVYKADALSELLDRYRSIFRNVFSRFLEHGIVDEVQKTKNS